MDDVSMFTPLIKDYCEIFKFGVYDIETRQTAGHIDATNFLGGIVLVDGEFHEFNDKESMKNFLLDLKFIGYTWFAHNAKYDMAGIFGNIIKTCDFKKKDSILFAGSRLISLKKCVYEKKNGKDKKTGKQKITRKYITFADSYNILPISIRKLGDALGFPKGEVDYATIEWDKLCIDYCKRDCEILDKSLTMFFNLLINEYKVEPRLTIAGNAMAIFRHNFYNEGEIIFSKKIDEECRNAYYGGRTEVYKERLEHGYCYDVNSLYPSVMTEQYSYPSPEYFKKKINTTPDELIEALNKFEGAANITVKTPNINNPLLPFKRADGKLEFPIGIFSGYYCFPEIRKAIELGYEILKVKSLIYALPIKSPFGKYINEMYNRRLACKESNDPTEIVFKLLMNGLYGKFGQKNKIQEIGDETNEDKIFNPEYEFKPFTEDSIEGYWCKKHQTPLEQRAKHDIVIWAAYVTSYARLTLYEYMEETRHNFAYCDTDSLFTSVELKTSKELGDMKLEKIVNNAQFIKPKHYSYESNGNKYMKIKGIKNDVIKDILSETQQYSRMTTPLEEIKHKIINPDTNKRYRAGEFKTIIKKICLFDDKRIHHANGETSPNSVFEDMEE